MQNLPKLIKTKLIPKYLVVKNRLSASLTNLQNSFFQKNSTTGGTGVSRRQNFQNQVRFVAPTDCVIVKMLQKSRKTAFFQLAVLLQSFRFPYLLA